MAIAFRSAANAVGVTGTKPTGVVSGDILVAHVIDEGNNTLTPPSGWTQIDNNRDAGAILRYASFWKLAGGSEPSTYAWTITGATYTEINIAAFSGCDTTTPINAHAFDDTAGSTSTPAIPSVTTTVANTMLSVGLSEWFGKDWSGFTPTGYSFDTGESTSGALDSASFHKAQAASGATGTTAVTWSNNSGGNPHTVTIVALAPATATAVSPVTPELVRSFAYAPPVKPLGKPGAPLTPLAAFAYAPPSGGAITAQAGVGIGVNASTTVQTAYSIACQPGVGIGVNASTTTLQTAYAVAPVAGVGIGVNAPTATLATAYAISPSAGLGIGVLANATVQTAYSVAASAGLGIGVLANASVATAYAMGLQAGLGIGVLVNITLNTGSQITTQAGLGIGVGQNVLVRSAQAITASPGLGIGVAGSTTLQTAYRLGMVAGLGIGVAQNISLNGFAGVPFSVTPRASGSVRAINGYAATVRTATAHSATVRDPDARSGVVR